MIPALLAVLAAGGCGGGGDESSAPVAPVVTSLTVTVGQTSLFVGQSTQATAVVLDAQGRPLSTTVSYASSAPGVATVSGTGAVAAVGAGSATITASAGSRTATATVTVQLVPAAAVELTPTRVSIVTADTLPLTVVVRDSTGTPITGHTVVWSVSDTTIATVSATGRVLPRRAGRVTVRGAVGSRSAASTVDISVGTGSRIPELAVFDSVIPALMAQYRFPGGSLAVMRGGRLLMARGYGWADTTARQPVLTSSRFRYASLSKSITGVAIAKLVETGRLRLDDKVFTVLNDLQPVAGATRDPRLADITVLQAITHTSGWHAAGDVDPLWFGRAVSNATGEGFPATARAYARYWMGLPLTYTPGTTFSYGQIGYVLAHLLIERASGRSYEEYVREVLLTPAGATRVQPGRTPLSGRLPDEVRYYYYPGDMPDNTAPTGTAPPEYGWHSIEGNLAAAGWVGTAVDYARVVSAIDGDATRPDVLNAASLELAYGKTLPLFANFSTWYGFGWYAQAGTPNRVLYHGGNTWGTANWVRRFPDGTTVVLLTNGPVAPNEQGIFTQINNAMVAAYNLVSTWPTQDLFPRF